MGRGLGRLMGKPAAPASAPQDAVTPGLRILIRGGGETSAPPAAKMEAAPPATPAKPAATPLNNPLGALTLIIADVALVIWPFIYLWQHNGPASLPALLGCAASLLFGAVAGVMAVVLWKDQP